MQRKHFPYHYITSTSLDCVHKAGYIFSVFNCLFLVILCPLQNWNPVWSSAVVAHPFQTSSTVHSKEFFSYHNFTEWLSELQSLFVSSSQPAHSDLSSCRRFCLQSCRSLDGFIYCTILNNSRDCCASKIQGWSGVTENLRLAHPGTNNCALAKITEITFFFLDSG